LQLLAFWEQVADRLRSTPGVETVALAGWPLSGMIWNSTWINGAPAEELTYFVPALR
jgi:hypothetical protein